MNGIKIPARDSLDLFVRATMNSKGWQSKSDVRETDLHMGSKDGRAVFNWRMKFALKVPCTFPRWTDQDQAVRVRFRHLFE